MIGSLSHPHSRLPFLESTVQGQRPRELDLEGGGSSGGSCRGLREAGGLQDWGPRSTGWLGGVATPVASRSLSL